MSTPERMDEQRQAAAKRRAFSVSPLRGLADRIQRAMSDYLAARASGMPRELATKGIDAELRELVPQTKYPVACVCQTCEDTGFEPQECEGHEGSHGPICGRSYLHSAHGFVRFCYCDKGQRLKGQAQPAVDDAAVEAAAKTRSRRRVNNWARAGR